MPTASAVDRVVRHAVILGLPIPSYPAHAAKARSQSTFRVSTEELERADDALVNDDHAHGARAAPATLSVANPQI